MKRVRGVMTGVALLTALLLPANLAQAGGGFDFSGGSGFSGGYGGFPVVHGYFSGGHVGLAGGHGYVSPLMTNSPVVAIENSPPPGGFQFSLETAGEGLSVRGRPERPEPGR